MYEIKEHFDIKREYNPATGEETNVISENTTDRPWNQRQHMRLDWGENQVLGDTDAVAEAAAALRGKKVSSGHAIGQNEDPLFNPNRPIFRRDYIDFSHKETRASRLSGLATGCSAPMTRSDRGSCGAAEITFRNSLLPVPEVSEYEPLAYPDRELIRGTDGKPVRMAFASNGIIPCTAAALSAAGLTGDDCTEAALDQFGEVRLLPHRAPGLRPAGRRDAGRAPVLHQPLEHLAGDRREGRRWQAAAGRAGELRAHAGVDAHAADDHLLPQSRVPGGQASCATWRRRRWRTGTRR